MNTLYARSFRFTKYGLDVDTLEIRVDDHRFAELLYGTVRLGDAAQTVWCDCSWHESGQFILDLRGKIRANACNSTECL